MTERTIYALGFFDGVHLGHQALLTACRELADKHNCRAGVLTFVGHPDTLVLGQTPKLLSTPADRRDLLKQYNMDRILELPFDKALMTTHWSAFLSDLVAKDAEGFVCGYDFRFGAGGLGTAKKLAGFCNTRDLPYAIVEQQTIDKIRVSSTHIRGLLEQGQIRQVNRFLGHPHRLTGKVISGRGLGHTIGIPTANLELEEDILLPKQGVYACTAHFDGNAYPAVTNIGSRPTVGGHHITVEPWLLHFNGDLYGKTLTLEFHAYLRREEKFDSLEDLQGQIRQDAEKTLKILGK